MGTEQNYNRRWVFWLKFALILVVLVFVLAFGAAYLRSFLLITQIKHPSECSGGCFAYNSILFTMMRQSGCASFRCSRISFGTAECV